MSFSIHKLTKLIVIPLQLSNLSKFNESSVDPDEQAHSVASNVVYIVGNDCFYRTQCINGLNLPSHRFRKDLK